MYASRTTGHVRTRDAEFIVVPVGYTPDIIKQEYSVTSQQVEWIEAGWELHALLVNIIERLAGLGQPLCRQDLFGKQTHCPNLYLPTG